MLGQKMVFESGNELAALAAKQINYHIMGYYPITPSTQVAEQLDLLGAEGLHDVKLIPAEGEHSAAGVCYGGTVGGGRVFNATSANGLLYAIEQLPVQSGTRFPMVLNVACRSISGPLSIKGDHSDIMYALNCGWIILFAKVPQEVYDFNIIALKVAEKLRLPVIVAYDGFFTSHQKRKVSVFEKDEDVLNFIGEYKPEVTVFDHKNPVTIGSYMNEPDLTNNKYQLHLAMEEAKKVIPDIFEEYRDIAGRGYHICKGYMTKDADVIIFILGSAFDTAKDAVDNLRQKGFKVGVATVSVLRPWDSSEIYEVIKSAKVVAVCDRQDSFGGGGGNLSIEVKALLKDADSSAKVITRIYGIGGCDFYVEDAENIFNDGIKILNAENALKFDYINKYKGSGEKDIRYFEPLSKEKSSVGNVLAEFTTNGNVAVSGGSIKESLKMPRRIAPGHGACPGCGIPINVNLLLKGISGNVVLLFHTGCGMVVTTAYPKTSFKVNYVHNLFQNGAATLSGVVEVYNQKVKRGEIPDEDVTFIMVSGDGGLDIGLGSAIGAGLRGHGMIVFEYDNGGYMNTGYQQSYSTPKGARSSTSHIGKYENGKLTFHKDNPQIFAAANIPYVATVAESQPVDFIKKAKKAQEYAKKEGMAYIKCLSACPLNWGDGPRFEKDVVAAGVDCCYHPLYEVERGITSISYDPEQKNKKIDVLDWLSMMGRTKHLKNEKFKHIVDEIQAEVDRRWKRLKIKNDCEGI